MCIKCSLVGSQNWCGEELLQKSNECCDTNAASATARGDELLSPRDLGVMTQ